MSGGVVQLAALGAQDVHLTGKPEVSFFRSTYKRHTHFAQSVERQLIQGTPASGAMSSIRIERKGDLLSYMYLTAKDSTGLVQNIDWTKAIEKLELYIGGQLIDTQDSTYNYLIASVLMADNFNQRFMGTSTTTNAAPASAAQNTIVNSFYPFKFFFCKDWTLSLPLVGLQFHDIEIRIYWLGGSPTIGPSATTVSNYTFEAWANFMYLDGSEREYFAKSDMDILITQVQRVVCPADYTAELVFSHPVKFIASNCATAYSSYAQQLKTQINGVDVGEYRGLPHWKDVPQYYHTQYALSGADGGRSQPGNPTPVVIVPFCLDTAKLQPTGTLNFSRIDSYRLLSLLGSGYPLMGTTANNILGRSDQITNYIYAVNYNILRIQKGMAGLLYSN
jgi:hypothetical protein